MAGNLRLAYTGAVNGVGNTALVRTSDGAADEEGLGHPFSRGQDPSMSENIQPTNRLLPKRRGREEMPRPRSEKPHNVLGSNRRNGSSLLSDCAKHLCPPWTAPAWAACAPSSYRNSQLPALSQLPAATTSGMQHRAARSAGSGDVGKIRRHTATSSSADHAPYVLPDLLHVLLEEELLDVGHVELTALDVSLFAIGGHVEGGSRRDEEGRLLPRF